MLASVTSKAPLPASAPVAEAPNAVTVTVTAVGGTAESIFACCQSKVRVSSTSCSRTSHVPATGSLTQ